MIYCVLFVLYTTGQSRSIELLAAGSDINLAKTLKHFVFATVYGCLFFVTALLQSWTFQIRFLLHITDYYHEPMNNNVIENMFNSTTSFKSLKCHLLLHPGHTANIRRKLLLPKRSFMCYKFSKALRLFT